MRAADVRNGVTRSLTKGYLHSADDARQASLSNLGA